MRAWSVYQFELYLALLCMLIGLPLAVGVAPSPHSITATLPPWVHIAWGISLSLGGLCTVFGILWRFTQPLQFVPGLQVEKAGLYMLGTSSVVLGLAISLYAGSAAILIAATYGMFFAACTSRIWTINKEVKVVKEHGEG